MRAIKFGFFVTLLFCLFSSPLVARAGEATDQLKATINQFMAIVTSTPVPELIAHGLPENALKLVLARFDFPEMTKLSLGTYWPSLDEKEQREFINAFAHRLLFSYGKTVRSSDHNRIEFDSEVPEGNQIKVETTVIKDNGDNLPIDYKMHDINGQWEVYDVVIDHISLINNYRAQFNRVIAQSSVRNLLQKLKAVN